MMRMTLLESVGGIIRGLSSFEKTRYVEKQELEKRVGEPIVKEMIGMRLIENNGENYAITETGENFYSLRKRNLFSHLL